MGQAGYVIGIFNQKGGVGKTTATINIAAELSKRGYRVMIVDTDGQGNLTKFFKINTEDQNTILEILKDNTPFNDTIIKVKIESLAKSRNQKKIDYWQKRKMPIDNKELEEEVDYKPIDIIPADKNLALFTTYFGMDTKFCLKFSNLFKEQAKKYHFVLFDCGPKLDPINIGVLAACNYLIIPTEAERFSMEGVLGLKDTFDDVKKNFNPDLEVLGLLITKYKEKSVLGNEAKEGLAQAAKLFDTRLFDSKIRISTDVPKSQSLGIPVYEYNPKSKTAQDYYALVNEIL